MRTVTVKGVKFTEAELQQALMDVTRDFQPGDIVRFIGGHLVNAEFIVVHPAVSAAHAAYWPVCYGAGTVALIGLTDGNSYSPDAKYIERVR